MSSAPPLLTVSPQTLHDTGVFGIWSVQDRSTPFKKVIEDRLDGAISYYQKAIEQHHWYGFWNFGDVRHSYDPARHEWRYDTGGFAWDNSELGSVLWLWESYIRTGRADIFRMAEAMIRHTSEVDTYHLGEFSGLGSRHNVSHWGDSAKEARISQSAHARFFYYLTTDERTGDIISAEANVDEVASKLDPMRKAQPITEAEKKYPGRIRFGPDWLGFVGNWMIEWERTGDTKWRDKIMAGVDSLYAMPYWARTGTNLVMGYDYNTGKLFQVSDVVGTYNLTTIQGGAEVAFELTDLLNDPKWTKIWLQYCRLGSANAATLTKDKETGAEGADATLVGERGGANSAGTPRLAGFAYAKTKDVAFAQRAVRALAAMRPDEFSTRRVEGSSALNPLDEAPGVSTNSTAQESLMAIEILEMCAINCPTMRRRLRHRAGHLEGGEAGAARVQCRPHPNPRRRPMRPVSKMVKPLCGEFYLQGEKNAGNNYAGERSELGADDASGHGCGRRKIYGSAAGAAESSGMGDRPHDDDSAHDRGAIWGEDRRAADVHEVIRARLAADERSGDVSVESRDGGLADEDPCGDARQCWRRGRRR